MSEIDDLERALRGKWRQPKTSAAAIASSRNAAKGLATVLKSAKSRQGVIKATVRMNRTKRGKVPVSLAPISGGKL